MCSIFLIPLSSQLWHGYGYFLQALALVSNSIQRDGCAVENLKMDVSQVQY